ncbi:Regulatory protein RecX [Vibrio stylophorae]|uniref:Regulatory protein RecX n=1 Tax=Vibrio stylophorae TaxID=659351 RepID=A0ABN8DY91_9VIBR|nr:regulatory protein RecX [Vibrio stylophorae]CAH0534342.1 Regulatory protein RecX [Vibrio stylophorae]
MHFGETEIELALQSCIEHRYLDDQRYGEMLIRHGQDKGHGVQRIRQQMQQKGLAQDLIESLLAHCEVDWFELARATYLRKYSQWGECLPTPIVDAKDRSKRMRFLLYRGFSFDQVQYALEIHRESE